MEGSASAAFMRWSCAALVTHPDRVGGEAGENPTMQSVYRDCLVAQDSSIEIGSLRRET